MNRRSLLLASLAAVLRADAEDDTWDLVASAARALVEATALPPPNRGSAAPFLSCFDPKMPNYETLRDYATALIEQADLQSSIDPLRNEGDDRARNLSLDWLLTMSNPATGIVATRREQEIRCRVEKQGNRWRIVSLEPVAFFAPPRG